MRLKVLVMPFLVVMILILSIGYIKPDLESIQARKADIITKNALVSDMDSILKNIDVLNRFLDERSQSEKFVQQYLPEMMDQDQAIDTANFLAAQSGVAIIEMNLKQPAVVAHEEPVLTSSAAPFVSGVDTAGAQGIPAVEPVRAKTFILTGTVMGSYENIKAFFDRITRMGRFHTTHVLSITTDPQTTSADGVVDISRLKGSFAMDLGYLPLKPVISALGMPVFLHSQVDISSVDALTERITHSVPALEKGQSGRPNPFQ